MHFGTNGYIVYLQQGDEEPAYTRLRIGLANGEAVAYVNPRRLGGVEFLEDPQAFITESDLGPDALDRQVNLAVFRSLLARTKRDIKSVLMDQKILAGIGNIYSDEILFQAGIHPRTPVEALSAAATANLYQALGATLEVAIRHRLDAEHDADAAPPLFLLPQRFKGGHCPKCGTELTSEKHGGRTSYACPNCQIAPSGVHADAHSVSRSTARSGT
jgi:formamidopyrimidine-DNA glycosylase